MDLVAITLDSLQHCGNNLREVGPSRKILHVRDVGSERRKSVERVVGSWVAFGATPFVLVFLAL